MDTHKEDFSPQQSLQIIQAMIDRTKHTVADRSYYFLLWGWLVFAAAISQYVVKNVLHSDLHGLVWNLMWLGAIFSAIHGRKENRIKRVKSYLDDSLKYLWIALGITNGSLVLTFALRGDWQNCFTYFILLYSAGCFATGMILKFKPLVWGSIVGWLLAILTVFATYDYNIIILAIAILVTYIIPGYLLRKEYRKKTHV